MLTTLVTLCSNVVILVPPPLPRQLTSSNYIPLSSM